MDPGVIDTLKKEFKPVGELTIAETIKYAKLLIQKNKEVRPRILEKIARRKSERFDAWVQLINLPWKYGIRAIDEKVSSIQHLQAALDEHRRTDEVVVQVKSLFHRLQNGRNSLAEENRILREIKCAQEHKEKLCLDVEPEKWWIPGDLREIVKSKKMINEHKELLFQELIVLRKQQKAYNSEAKQLKKKLEVAERDINSLQKEMDSISQQNERLNIYISKRKGIRKSMLRNALEGIHP